MYGVASASRIDKIIGLFCKRALSKRRYSAKETYNIIDLTDRSHPIVRHIIYVVRYKWSHQFQVPPPHASLKKWFAVCMYIDICKPMHIVICKKNI